jgi:predicted nuclease with TOPRIM domain
MDDDNNIRPPDKIYKETLIDSYYTDDDDYDYDNDELKMAIEQSIKECSSFSSEELKKQEEELKKQEEELKKQEIENKKQEELKNKKQEEKNERKKKLGKLYEKLLAIKYHNKDNITNTFILLLLIMNNYINCNCNEYDVNIEIYNDILYELSKIRIKAIEFNEICNFLNIIPN